MSVKVWIQAARLRTLPLAIAGAIAGNLIAYAETHRLNKITFLLSVFWKRTTKLAVNIILSAGSAVSLFTGMLNLWILPPNAATGENLWWPHYFLVSFYLFAFLFVSAVVISLADKNKVKASIEENEIPKTSKQVKILFALLGLVILTLYIIFNGH